MVRMLVVVGVVVTLFIITNLFAQGAKPRFDVASVRPAEPMSGAELFSGGASVRSPGVFRRRDTLQSLLLFAYDILPVQLVGAPAWVSRDNFSIEARYRDDSTPAEIRLMLQSLLEDRFMLRSHIEPREMDHLALVRAHREGTLGPGLLPIESCSGPIVTELRRKDPEKYPAPFGGGLRSGCVPSMRALATILLDELQTLVVDATELKGSYYYALRYQRMERRTGDALDLPALSTALREQLGLKLEARRAPIDVLVIKSVQPPSEN
jgi:uncharacterized protein (TIGR03435 family)